MRWRLGKDLPNAYSVGFLPAQSDWASLQEKENDSGLIEVTNGELPVNVHVACSHFADLKSGTKG